MRIQGLLPVGLKELGQVAFRSRIPLLFVAAVAVTSAAIATHAFGQFPANKPKLNTAQKRLVRKLEQQLVTPLNSKDENPGDRDTWYVILFTDTVAGARQSSEVSGNVLTITRELQRARHSAVKIAHGRQEAALLLLQFGFAENTAATKLRPMGRGETDYARAVGAKNWEFRAFATENEAKTFLDSVTPPEKK